MGCGSSNAGDQLAGQQAQQQQWTDQSVQNINNAFAGFTPQFYQGVGQAYQNYQMPLLQQQYQSNKDQTGFKLADQGLQNSSQAQNMYNQLNQANSQGQQQIAQGALGQQQTLQQQVSNEQANLIGQAQTATNPSAIGQQAISNAASFAAPSSFQPLGQMFNNYATQYLGNQQNNAYNPATLALLSQYGGYGGYGGGGGGGYIPKAMY